MKVSVALCTFNGEKFLDEQLQSILNQIHPVDEIVICDDKSTDATAALIENYADKYSDRIKYIQNKENIGAIRSFEKCIGLCSGDVIFLSDQDDIWAEDKVGKTLDFFKEDSKALMVFSDGDLIDENGKKLTGSLWAKWNFTEDLRTEWKNNNQAFKYLLKNQNKITGATVAIKSILKKSILPFDLPKGTWHDSWIGLVASGYGGLRFINNSLIKYRIHGNQQVGIGNGINLTVEDNKFSNISHHNFLVKVSKLFPEKIDFIFPSRPNFVMRMMKKLDTFHGKLFKNKT